jgi:hypothetical protein
MSSRPCPCLHVSGIPQTENKHNKNGNFRLFSANGKQKLPFVAASGNGKRTFVLLGRKRSTVIDDCSFSKSAHLQYVYTDGNLHLSVFGALVFLVVAEKVSFI